MQAETQTALDNLDAIAATDGVDGVFIGPADLSASLGYLGNPTHPNVQAAIADAFRRIRAAGKAPGILMTDPVQAQRYLDAELIALEREGTPLGLPIDESGQTAADPLEQRIRIVRGAAQHQRDVRRFIADTLEHLPIGVVVIDQLDRVILHNERARHLLRAFRSDALLSALRALPWPAYLPMRDGLPDVSGYSGIRQFELTPDKKRYLLVSVADLFSESSDRPGRVIGLADVTTMHEAQRSREDTMHFLSHDLRAPLASILTLIDGYRDSSTLQAEQIPRIARYARSALDLALWNDIPPPYTIHPGQRLRLYPGGQGGVAARPATPSAVSLTLSFDTFVSTNGGDTRQMIRTTPPWTPLAVASAGQFMLVLDVSVVNVALPDIQSGLAMADGTVQWVVTGYALTFAGGLLVGGRLADLWGVRRVFIAGLLLFTAASMVGGLADSAAILIAARAVQGMGAAIASPAAGVER